MAKIGNSDYPDIGLHECLRIAGIIQRDFGGEVRRSGLARVLDMSPNGGAFGARLGAMRSWNIVQGRSTLRLTTDATAALEHDHPPNAGSGSHHADAAAAADAEIRAEAMHRLASSVPLIADLHHRLPDGPIERAVLVAAIEELTDASVEVIEARTTHLERIFLEARRYLQATTATQPSQPTTRSDADRRAQSKGAAGSASPGSGETNRVELRFAGGEIVLDETPDNIQVLIDALSRRRRKLLGGQDDDPPRIAYLGGR